MMTQREQLLRELTAMQECQAEVRPQAAANQKWLTPRTAAMLEGALVGLALLLCVLVLVQSHYRPPTMPSDGQQASSQTATSQAPRHKASKHKSKILEVARKQASEAKGNGTRGSLASGVYATRLELETIVVDLPCAKAAVSTLQPCPQTSMRY